MHPQLLSQFDAVIDARSPAEFEQDHAPGALSAPVLGNEERARVGTVYKQASPFEAKKLGAALVARNIASHVEASFAPMPREWRPLVYCWRGGKRSGAMVHILREIGWDAFAIEGGYKAYRRCVIDELAVLPAQLRFRVIQGNTGSGKSRFLRALERAGTQVLDLEDLAAHRGSVLGELPERPQPAQKMFESLLWNALCGFDPSQPIFVEGESKKIGQLQVPEALIHAMRASDCIVLEAGRETRIALLSEEYSHYFAAPERLYAQLDCLAGLYGERTIADWKACAGRGEWPLLIGRLLDEHYDPAYGRSAARNFEQLPRAPRLRLGAPTEAAFDSLARELIGETALEAA